MSKAVNILFLGGARRVTMARMFKAAGKELGLPEVNIFSYETSTHVPVSVEGKVIIGRLWRDADLYEHLHATVEEYGITVMIPFVDGAVAVAQEYARRYPGRVYVPAEGHSEFMFDKIKADEVFRAHGLPVPESFTVDSLTDGSFPIIMKPRFGSASKGIKVVGAYPELLFDLYPERKKELEENYLIQRFVRNSKEYTADCFVTLGGEMYVSARERLEVTGGEVTRTVTTDRSDVHALSLATLRAIGLKGAVTVQIIRDCESDRCMVMEVNPRLGGGAVCSVNAGFNLPKAILCEALGLPVEPMKAAAGVEMIRYFQELMIYPE